MKNNLHFKNFRKFQEFPTLEFNDITFLVGKNNSGKSTFVKAILLIYNYMKSGNIQNLDFNQSNYEDVNIVTYGRAFNKKMIHEGHLRDFISNHICFSISLTSKNEKFSFFVNITGEEDDTEVQVLQFDIDQHTSDFSVRFSPNYKKINIIEKQNSNYVYLENNLKSLKTRKDNIEAGILNIKDELAREHIELNSQLEKVKENISDIMGVLEIYDLNQEETEFSTFYNNKSLNAIFNEAFENFVETFKIYESVNLNSSEEEEEEEENYSEGIEDLDDEIHQLDNIDIFNKNKDSIKNTFSDILSFIENLNIVYLPATLNKHSTLFSIKDSKNSLAQIIHKYYQVKVEDKAYVELFVNKWLKEFSIGEGIEIKQIEGEAYTANIKQNGLLISLADAGMGAIQATLLILRMASVITDNKDKEKEIIVIIEEPELNLHPALQSKLCDLFYEVYKNYNIKFIVETHSEYIIRRSQVLNAINEFGSNDTDLNPTPFSTVYFSSESDNVAYSMNYQTDGTFENAFGEGFFDASSASTLELIRLRRLQNLKI